MKKAITTGVLGLLIVLMSIPYVAFAVTASATTAENPYVKPVPKHSKWGALAVAEAKKRYQQALVVDYLHVGRQVVSPSTNQEVFKLWLKDNHREFGLFVRILFDTHTEKVLRISCQETQR